MRKARGVCGIVALGFAFAGCERPGTKHDEHDMPGAVLVCSSDRRKPPYFRIYGPDQAAFDGSWKPGDPEVEQ